MPKRFPSPTVLLSGLSAAATTLVPLLIFIYLARRLDAPAIGAVIYAVTVVEMLKALCPLGLYEAVLSSDDYPAAAPVAGGILAGVAGAATLVFVAVLLVSATQMPSLHDRIWYALAIGLKLPFDILVLQPQAHLVKQLKVRQLASRGLLANAGAAVAGVAAAAIWGAMTGLVLYYLAQASIIWIATRIGAGIGTHEAALGWRYDPAVARALVPVAWPASQVRMLGAVNSYADQLVTGVTLGPADLARYNLGKRTEVAQFGVAGSLIGILYQPRFAQRDTPHEVRHYFRQALLLFSLCCGIPAVLFAVNAGMLVPLVFGAQWAAAAPIAAALALGGFARAFGAVHGSYQSLNGDNGDVRNRSVVSAASGLLLLGVAPAAGLIAVAALVATKNVGIALWGMVRLRALAGLAVYVRVTALPLAGALAGALAGLWLGRAIPDGRWLASDMAGLLLSLLLGSAGGIAGAVPALRAALRR